MKVQVHLNTIGFSSSTLKRGFSFRKCYFRFSNVWAYALLLHSIWIRVKRESTQVRTYIIILWKQSVISNETLFLLHKSAKRIRNQGTFSVYCMYNALKWNLVFYRVYTWIQFWCVLKNGKINFILMSAFNVSIKIFIFFE